MKDRGFFCVARLSCWKQLSRQMPQSSEPYFLHIDSGQISLDQTAGNETKMVPILQGNTLKCLQNIQL